MEGLAEQDCSLKVFYDGSCPLCVREVAVYRSVPTPTVNWVDVSDATSIIPSSMAGERPERSMLLARFHVLTPEGQWLHGARAFTALWGRLSTPWRVLAMVCRLPGVRPVMDRIYALFLRWRPTLQAIAQEWVQGHTLPHWMVPAIRSDHAGETGAVYIYLAMLRFGRDASIRDMLREHLEQERRHLDLINRLLPWKHRSLLLPLWRLAGYFTGLLPAILGPRWMLATIASVEQFVDRHYQEQINALTGVPGEEKLLTLLTALRSDELKHRDDALHALASRNQGEQAVARSARGPSRNPPQHVDASGLLAAWQFLVGHGSALAVLAAKKI